jgi:hypothetical protein
MESCVSDAMASAAAAETRKAAQAAEVEAARKAAKVFLQCVFVRVSQITSGT